MVGLAHRLHYIGGVSMTKVLGSGGGGETREAHEDTRAAEANQSKNVKNFTPTGYPNTPDIANFPTEPDLSTLRPEVE